MRSSRGRGGSRGVSDPASGASPSEEFAKRLPVLLPPARVQMHDLGLGSPVMVEDELRLPSLGAKLEPHDRINPFGPVEDAPRLDDSLVGEELDIASRDEGAEADELAALRGVDLGGSLRDLPELARVEEGVINLPDRGVEGDFLMDLRHAFSPLGKAPLSKPALNHHNQYT